jgi:hypothetical protein
MRKRILLGIGSMVGMLAVMVGPVVGAAAQAAGLPTFKFAPSARFDLTGSISVGGAVSTLSGPGMLAGDQFQQDLTVMPPGGAPPIMLNQIQIGSMYYFKLTGSDQWQSIDLSKTPGNVPNIQSTIPGLNGFNPNGGQRTYEAAVNSRATGQETISGVTTTKTEAGVDVAKLYRSLGAPEAQAAQIAAVSKMSLTLWIGDEDDILYQQRVVLNTKAAGPGGTPIDVVVDFTITYHDIGTAVAITAPSGAVSYVPKPAAPAPAATPMPAATPAPAPGMPTTGGANPAGLLVLLGAGLLALLTGGLVRRMALVRR